MKKLETLLKDYEDHVVERASKGISLCNLLGGINGRVSTTCKSDVFSKAELFDDVVID